MANYTDPIKTRDVWSITSSATPTYNVDKYQFISITALAVAITSMTSGKSGSPVDFQELTFRIKDDGTNRAITWGADFIAKGVALPTTTAAGKLLTTTFQYDTVTAKWGCIRSVVEA